MSGPFRKEYRVLSDAEKARLAEIKTKAEELYELLRLEPADGRCAALSITKLEECIMWAVKART